jgi:hypothetical protein
MMAALLAMIQGHIPAATADPRPRVVVHMPILGAKAGANNSIDLWAPPTRIDVHQPARVEFVFEAGDRLIYSEAIDAEAGERVTHDGFPTLHLGSV